MTQDKKKHYGDLLDAVANQSSTLERRAEEVERETVKMKKAEYMESHLGEIFEGTISGVMEWGILRGTCQIQWKGWCMSIH